MTQLRFACLHVVPKSMHFATTTGCTCCTRYILFVVYVLCCNRKPGHVFVELLAPLLPDERWSGASLHSHRIAEILYTKASAQLQLLPCQQC